MSNSKLQYLLIKYLEKNGSVKLALPDGVTVEIGVNQLDSHGELVKIDNYCWVMASREDKMAVLDSYNLGLRFSNEEEPLIFEDRITNTEGEEVRMLDVV